jgi:hypothetical protein
MNSVDIRAEKCMNIKVQYQIRYHEFSMNNRLNIIASILAQGHNHISDPQVFTTSE